MTVNSLFRIVFILFFVSSFIGKYAFAKSSKSSSRPSRTPRKRVAVSIAPATPRGVRRNAPKQKPSFTSNHDESREESSMGHISTEESVFVNRPDHISVPENEESAYEQKTATVRSLESLLNANNLRDAVLLSEILAPPKVRRFRR